MSLVHIVLFHLKAGIAPEDPRLTEFGLANLAMKGEAEGLIDIEVGKTLPDQFGMGGGYDFVTLARMEKQDNVKAWHKHPAHAKATALYKELFENTIILDFEPGKYH